MANAIVIDYETEAIEARPHYPPRPVGVAISYPSGESEYLAWGHPVENNCDEAAAKRRVRHLLTSHDLIIAHNYKFEYEVTQKWLGYAPSWDRWGDTMLLAFLDNPHSDTLALKPLAEKLLGMAPEERDMVRDWLVEQGVEKKNCKSWGKSIAKAPGGLVGKYAVGDVVRTRKLHDLLYAKVRDMGMLPAYERERKLIPIMIRNEQEGIRCDVENLVAHEAECAADFAKVDDWIREHLSAPSLNLDENDSLADALDAAGKIEGDWVLTEKGERSTAKPALAKMLSDRKLYAALMYRGSMATCLRTFMRPWIDLANSNNGRLCTTWNTTRQEEGGGTRTGRLSSAKPLNLQNIPNDFEEKLGDLFRETRLLDDLDLGELPNMRSYIVADSKDHVLLGRDFSSQEPRTFAHFENGWLCAKYNVEPKMDVYRELMAVTKERSGLEMTRKQAKVVFLGLLYGMGKDKLAGQLGTTPVEAQTIKDALMAAVPSIKEISDVVKRELESGDYIRTWGGRVYHAEPAKLINGQLRTFAYKGLNVLVQGSASDETKEAVIRYVESAKDSRMLLQVHDEIVISCHRDHAEREMANLRRCMETLELDVPMLSEGEWGYRWGDMKEFKE